MYIISLSCIIYTYCKLILKSPSGRINKKVLYCIVSLFLRRQHFFVCPQFFYRLHNLYSNHLQSQSVSYCVRWSYRLRLLTHYWSITSRCFVVLMNINSLRLLLVVSLGHSLIWPERVCAGEQFYYFASRKEYLFGHGNPKSRECVYTWARI